MSVNADGVYADSSFLFSLIGKDSQTPRAIAYMMRAPTPLCFTPLHRIELRNGLRNAVGRGAINADEHRVAFRQIEHDLHEGIFSYSSVEWTNVFRRADELSERHAARHGPRTIDLLHVAIAIECGATTFLTFDKRQAALAKAAGLKVKP